MEEVRFVFALDVVVSGLLFPLSYLMLCMRLL